MFQEDMMSPATTSTTTATTTSPASLSSPYGAWVQELSQDQHGVRLVRLLYQCAADVAVGSFDRANLCLECIMQLASLDAPHTLQRLAAVFADALARKLLSPIPGVSRALLSASSSPDPHLLPVARSHFFDLFPFLKLAFLTTNQAILEAMEGEKNVHIVDFSGPAANPVQWIALLHAFRGRREGPPHLRVTAVHDDKDALASMSAVLAKEADLLDMSFQFYAVMARLDTLDYDALRANLRIKSGEALAISAVLQLHRLLAASDAKRNAGLSQLQLIARSSPGSFGELLERELTRLHLSPDAASLLSSLSPQSPSLQKPKLGSFLTAVKALSPKIMVVTEQEANHNGAAFYERFEEALRYYASLFDCLERAAEAAGRSAAERARVERLVLGEEIKNIVACDGAERKERHERLQQWAQRMAAAGFGPVRLSYSGIMEANKLMQSCGWVGYEVRQDGNCFFFCWHKRPLYSVSAWRAT